MESIRCNLCDSGQTDLLFSKKDKFRISEDDFDIVRCRSCGLLYINPRPTQEEIIRFYPETYSWKENLPAGSFFTGIIRKAEKTYRQHLLNYEVNKVLRFTGIQNGKVLDIGCGPGDRLDIFRKKGFDAYGIEISSSARYAKEKLGLNVFEGNLDGANYPDNFFDIVTLYNVLEHVHNPRQLLQIIKRIIKNEGSLVIQVPNTDSWQLKIFKERWSAFDVPRDLYYFNPDILSRILQREGFEPVKISRFNNWWHPPTIVTTLFPGLDPPLSWLAESNKEGRAMKRLFWIFWTLILPVFTFCENLLGNSALITTFSKVRRHLSREK